MWAQFGGVPTNALFEGKLVLPAKQKIESSSTSRCVYSGPGLYTTAPKILDTFLSNLDAKTLMDVFDPKMSDAENLKPTTSNACKCGSCVACLFGLEIHPEPWHL